MLIVDIFVINHHIDRYTYIFLMIFLKIYAMEIYKKMAPPVSLEWDSASCGVQEVEDQFCWSDVSILFQFSGFALQP